MAKYYLEDIDDDDHAAFKAACAAKKMTMKEALNLFIKYVAARDDHLNDLREKA